MSLRSGITIVCDAPECTASADDLKETRGWRRADYWKLVALMEWRGWIVINRSRETDQHFCPAHKGDRQSERAF
jgi:hypothetical protein